jgi:hypothetical protein
MSGLVPEYFKRHLKSKAEAKISEAIAQFQNSGWIYMGSNEMGEGSDLYHGRAWERRVALKDFPDNTKAALIEVRWPYEHLFEDFAKTADWEIHKTSASASATEYTREGVTQEGVYRFIENWETYRAGYSVKTKAEIDSLLKDRRGDFLQDWRSVPFLPEPNGN